LELVITAGVVHACAGSARKRCWRSKIDTLRPAAAAGWLAGWPRRPGDSGRYALRKCFKVLLIAVRARVSNRLPLRLRLRRRRRKVSSTKLTCRLFWPSASPSRARSDGIGAACVIMRAAHPRLFLVFFSGDSGEARFTSSAFLKISISHFRTPR